MNQILFTNKHSKVINFFKFQLFFSIFIIIGFIIFFIFNKYSINKKENLSHILLNNYSISRLYTNDSNSEITYSSNNFDIIGIIKIDKINIYYPIISESTDELLKIAPCKLSGPNIGQYGNLCIAGHNYDNNKFFSKLNLLNINDKITVYDLQYNTFDYIVDSSYEVTENDLSPIKSDYSKKELTLITCNNLNLNRLIVKCILNS